MRYLTNIQFFNDQEANRYQEINLRWRQYREFLDIAQPYLGINAYAFAIAPWHYDVNDYRSLHDAHVLEIHFEPLPYEQRWSKLKLLNRSETHFITIKYMKVYEFNISYNRNCHGSGSEDLLIDEIGFSCNEKTTHTLVFASGAMWEIEFDDLEISFEPVGVER